MGKNLTRIVGDLRLKVPCKNRDAGCPHKCVEDEMEEHEDKCGIEKSDVTLAARIFLSRTCFITSEMNIKRILKPRSGSCLERKNQWKMMSLFSMKLPT